MSKVTVMIIDEEAFFRVGVRQVLSQESDFKILDCDPNQDPLKLIDANLPEVVLLGSNLASHNGLDLGARISRFYPNTKVIMLSPNPDDEQLFQVIKTAAVACLNRNSATEELIGTIRRASRGEYPINETVMSRPRVAGRGGSRPRVLARSSETGRQPRPAAATRDTLPGARGAIRGRSG